MVGVRARLGGVAVRCTEPNRSKSFDGCDTGPGKSGTDPKPSPAAEPVRKEFSKSADDDSGASPSSPIPDALSSSRSTCFEPDPGTGIGNERDCGKGDGGAGQRPGRAAARSMRLSVCWCSALFTFARGFGSADVNCSFGGGPEGRRGDFARGRGGDGVRSTGEVSKLSNPAEFRAFRKDFSEDKLSPNDGDSNDCTDVAALKEWKSVKSSSSNADGIEASGAFDHDDDDENADDGGRRPDEECSSPDRGGENMLGELSPTPRNGDDGIADGIRGPKSVKSSSSNMFIARGADAEDLEDCIDDCCEMGGGAKSGGCDGGRMGRGEGIIEDDIIAAIGFDCCLF